MEVYTSAGPVAWNSLPATFALIFFQIFTRRRKTYIYLNYLKHNWAQFICCCYSSCYYYLQK